MTSSKIAAVVLGAGKGTRMKSDLPKVLMPICGKPMIRNILDTLDGMDADKIVVVTAPDGELVRKRWRRTGASSSSSSSAPAMP